MIKLDKSSFVRNLARGRLLVPYLERYDKWDQPFEFRYEPKQGDDAWHPSGDCTPPATDLYAKATGSQEREEIAPSLQRTFLVGHFWHQVIQNALVDMDLAAPEAIERRGKRVWLDKNTWVYPDKLPESWVAEPKPYHWACGAGDVAPLVLPKWQGILDIKTMNSNDFKQAGKSGVLPDRFADKYYAQMQIYMDLFDQEKGMILGVNKDSPHNFLEFVYDRDQDLIDGVYAKWMYVSDCLDRQEAPDDAMFPLPV